nr:uracil-DNA glycosylase family protein [uncultured Olsenella sp.]
MVHAREGERDAADTARKVELIRQEIRDDPQNADYTRRGIDPLFIVGADARIVIVGQAPGVRAQDSGMPWNDRSGQRLRSWMGVDDETFYDSGKIAIMNMDFYFPGTGRSGDLPPRAGFAQKWHPRLLEFMPRAELMLLVGGYAMRRYLGLPSSARLGDVVRDFRRYAPGRFPLVHPSPRNQLWMGRNPWFEEDVVPALRRRVAEALRD